MGFTLHWCTIELAIPRVRDGSYFPSLLEPRRRAERALLAVIQEAYVLGVSTRRVEDLVEALGIASVSRSEVSRSGPVGVCRAAADLSLNGSPASAGPYPSLGSLILTLQAVGPSLSQARAVDPALV